tara:strand:+ start:525 stop:1112 length:588 start_codon:yes stop_codon:yes gene_type:complete
MPVTHDINIFIKRYKFGVYNVPGNVSSTPITPVCSPNPTTSIPQLFVKASIDSLVIGDIVKYNQRDKQMLCKVIKIASSKQSFKKVDGDICNGKFISSGQPNLINKDTLIHTRKIYKLYDFKSYLWKQNLMFLLKQNFSPTQTFSASDIYSKCEKTLQEIYPKSETIRASIRANMQYLRDDGMITFISRGKYKFN